MCNDNALQSSHEPGNMHSRILSFFIDFFPPGYFLVFRSKIIPVPPIRTCHRQQGPAQHKAVGSAKEAFINIILIVAPNQGYLLSPPFAYSWYIPCASVPSVVNSLQSGASVHLFTFSSRINPIKNLKKVFYTVLYIPSFLMCAFTCVLLDVDDPVTNTIVSLLFSHVPFTFRVTFCSKWLRFLFWPCWRSWHVWLAQRSSKWACSLTLDTWWSTSALLTTRTNQVMKRREIMFVLLHSKKDTCYLCETGRYERNAHCCKSVCAEEIRDWIFWTWCGHSPSKTRNPARVGDNFFFSIEGVLCCALPTNMARNGFLLSSKGGYDWLALKRIFHVVGRQKKQLVLNHFPFPYQRETAPKSIGGNGRFDHEWFYRSRPNDVQRNRWFWIQLPAVFPEIWFSFPLRLPPSTVLFKQELMWRFLFHINLPRFEPSWNVCLRISLVMGDDYRKTSPMNIKWTARHEKKSLSLLGIRCMSEELHSRCENTHICSSGGPSACTRKHQETLRANKAVSTDEDQGTLPAISWSVHQSVMCIYGDQRLG